MVQNKITRLYPNAGAPLTDTEIQDHLDEQNADGWELIYVDNLVGWYRMFWVKRT